MIVDIKKLKKSFSDGSKKLHVLKDINLQIDKGSIITIKGPSGSGKSTLLSIIGTLDNADSGELLINGMSIKTITITMQIAIKKLLDIRNLFNV